MSVHWIYATKCGKNWHVRVDVYCRGGGLSWVVNYAVTILDPIGLKLGGDGCLKKETGNLRWNG